MTDPVFEDGFPDHPPRTPKVMAITGGGSGIGRVMAQAFAEDGWEVVIIGRRRATLEETAADQDRIHIFEGDIADPDNITDTFARVQAEGPGPVDVLVANAAVYPKGHFLDQPAEEFNRTLRINVEGVANSVRAVLPGMLARRYGRIVVVGSLADMNPLPGSLAYSVSKGALHSMVKGIAGEISPDHYPDVLINEMTPGATRTAMAADGQPPEAVVPYVRKLIALPSGGPSGRFFNRDQELRLGESWKGAIKRILLRRG